MSCFIFCMKTLSLFIPLFLFLLIITRRRRLSGNGDPWKGGGESDLLVQVQGVGLCLHGTKHRLHISCIEPNHCITMGLNPAAWVWAGRTRIRVGSAPRLCSPTGWGMLSKPHRASQGSFIGISLEAFSWEFWGLENREQNQPQMYSVSMNGV